ncbi:hypothetical protein [Pantoea septica]|uniref:hypothetical protein n=1 Tax=Pantoea septica TaxID=472695 RepID=UPI0028A76662|nr:hypothetical protein [Pantoea septica]
MANIFCPFHRCRPVPKGDAQDRGSLVENEAEGLMRKGSLRCYTFNGETGRKAAVMASG